MAIVVRACAVKSTEVCSGGSKLGKKRIHTFFPPTKEYTKKNNNNSEVTEVTHVIIIIFVVKG